MDNINNLAPHEMLVLRELMDTNLVGAKKIKASMPMVKDNDLKSFMERCLNTKKENINSMETFIGNSLNIE